MSSKDLSLSYKFLMLGDPMVGKTSIIERYINKSFKTDYITTIGMDKRFKKMKINNVNVDISITDTAGQERFRSITKMYYKGADGILVGFSLTEKKSLENISFWIDQINQNCSKEYPISLVLFGNKCDDKNNIQVTQDEIDKIKNKYNLQYFETSAKEDINIKEVFEYLTKATIMQRGHFKNIGLNKEASIDKIILEEREEQNVGLKRKKTKNKRKRKCW
jgi:small GTP-binding protein